VDHDVDVICDVCATRAGSHSFRVVNRLFSSRHHRDRDSDTHVFKKNLSWSSYFYSESSHLPCEIQMNGPGKTEGGKCWAALSLIHFSLFTTNTAPHK